MLLLHFCQIIWIFSQRATFGTARNVEEEKGHLKPFGSTNSLLKVKEIEGFPEPRIFFEEYVLLKKPVVLKGAGKVSPAFAQWTDEYFISFDESKSYDVHVETMKKEDRKQMTHDMPFLDFVQEYNDSGIYMVSPVPDFISNDIVVPCSLQCDDIIDGKLVESVMWFSSGGTKSVVHTDSVDNINCLYRGEKQFVMVDPEVYGDKVDIDHPEGAYSGVDVDRVDYTKYPGLADVKYYTVNITAGDCLFIPYKWIHQVRSYGSNIAVNIWWNHFKNKDIDLSHCNQKCDASLTLENVKFGGFEQVMESIESIKDHFEGMLLTKKELNYSEFATAIIGKDKEEIDASYINYDRVVKKIFKPMDTDSDGKMTKKELESLPESTWRYIQHQMGAFGEFMENVDKMRHGDFRFKDEL